MGDKLLDSDNCDLLTLTSTIQHKIHLILSCVEPSEPERNPMHCNVVNNTIQLNLFLTVVRKVLLEICLSCQLTKGGLGQYNNRGCGRSDPFAIKGYVSPLVTLQKMH